MRRSYSGLRRGFAAVAREQRRIARLDAQLHLIAARQAKQEARQTLADHVAVREAETADRIQDIRDIEDDLDAILKDVDDGAAAFDFETMTVRPEAPSFDAGGYDVSPMAPQIIDFLPLQPSILMRLIPAMMRRYEQSLDEARKAFDQAAATYHSAEAQRKEKLEQRRVLYSLACKAAEDEATAKNAEVIAFRSAYMAAEREAVIDYFKLVFDADQLPEGMPTSIRVTYDADSKQLLAERELPTIDAVPDESGFRYVKKGDSIVPILRKASERKAIYADALAKVALRTVRVALKADVAKTTNVFSFNGFVNTIDPQTGTRVRPTLISLTASRDVLEAIAFDLVDAVQCLRGLKALISRNAPELEAVRPLVQFDMVDRRFIEKTDVLSDLDSRPNLAELSPSEFEALMTNLFEKMGLETRLTQASRDGGVDCVAWDMRPVVGGKVVIQAKRYRNTVGVSAVRDLYGTMMNEGAAKGLLVSTTGYGDSAYEFAKNKPLELITGGNLLSLLDEYTHVKARIEFPLDWVDPTMNR